MLKHKSKIYVAMSGGVDSSVAAAILKKQGFDVIGVFFKPWQPTLCPEPYTSSSLKLSELNGLNPSCQWEQDRLDAMKVAVNLGIEFKTWDFSKEYERHVAKYMISAYRAGITPNPDVMCNKEIKFGLFLKKALTEGADYIATGHYVRKIDRTSYYTLHTAKDKNKDQSYFLWTLTQKQLRHCLFPIGDYTKPEVREMAKRLGLANHDKKDSQGVCFVGQLNMKEFLTNYIKPRLGEIKLMGNNLVIGRHDGVYYYTIGQRHGLNIKNGHGPYFVISKDIKKNIIYVTNVASSPQLSAPSLKIKSVNWIENKPSLPMKVVVKIRYRTKALPAVIITAGKGLVVKFKKPAKAVTPGQSAVFYKGEEMLGGGIIASD